MVPSRFRTVTRALPMRRSIEAYEEFKKDGGEVYVPTPDEKPAFQEAIASLKDWLVENYGDEWLNNLQGAIDQCQTKIEADYADALK